MLWKPILVRAYGVRFRIHHQYHELLSTSKTTFRSVNCLLVTLHKCSWAYDRTSMIVDCARPLFLMRLEARHSSCPHASFVGYFTISSRYHSNFYSHIPMPPCLPVFTDFHVYAHHIHPQSPNPWYIALPPSKAPSFIW